MKKLAVVVGRFQADEITEGQVKLIELAQQESDMVLIVIGESRSRLSFTNPLPFEARKKMILTSESLIGGDKWIKVVKLIDEKLDPIWSMYLDKIIAKELGHEDFSKAILFAGRDSFKKHYSGKVEVREVSFGIDEVAASKRRQKIHEEIGDTKQWRAGVIFASAHRYPVSYQTVDVAIVNYNTMEILLGKRDTENGYRFIGGHVDPEDESLEKAAYREACEECDAFEFENFNYVGSYRIDDWRHKKEKDKIMTAFFTCTYFGGSRRLKAKDDIQEVKWFRIQDLKNEEVEPEHHILLEELKRHINNTKFNH